MKRVKSWHVASPKKAEVYQMIQELAEQIIATKDKKKQTDRKITFAALPEDKKFTNAINVRKQFMDNIKMIAYRAETAMYNMIKNQLSHPDEGRQLVQKIYTSDANIIPDSEGAFQNVAS